MVRKKKGKSTQSDTASTSAGPNEPQRTAEQPKKDVLKQQEAGGGSSAPRSDPKPGGDVPTQPSTSGPTEQGTKKSRRRGKGQTTSESSEASASSEGQQGQPQRHGQQQAQGQPQQQQRFPPPQQQGFPPPQQQRFPPPQQQGHPHQQQRLPQPHQQGQYQQQQRFPPPQQQGQPQQQVQGRGQQQSAWGRGQAQVSDAAPQGRGRGRGYPQQGETPQTRPGGTPQTQPPQPGPAQAPQAGPWKRPDTSGQPQAQPVQPDRGAEAKAKGDSFDTKSVQGEIKKISEKKGAGDSKDTPPVRRSDLATFASKLKRTLGTKGRVIRVETNHFPLNLGNLQTAIHYDIVFDPMRPKRLFRTAYNKFREQNFPKRYPAFDGVKNLYCNANPLPFGDSIDGEVEVVDYEDDRTHRFKISIKRVSTVDMSVLNLYLNTNDERILRNLNMQEALQCIDIVLRHAAAGQFIQVGRSYFTPPRDAVYLGDGMGLYQGFFQSTILGWKPFVNVDVAHKAFPDGGNVIDVIMKMFENFRQPEDLLTAQREKQTFIKFITGLKVEYQIPGASSTKRVFKVHGVEASPQQSMFQKDDGTRLSVLDYFLREKNYRIKYPKMPTLWVGRKDREQKVLLPVELCTVLRDQVVNKKLTENQTRQMIRHAATNTDTRKNKIMHSMQTARFERSETVREFGFSVSSRFLELDARVLNPPELQYNTGPASVRKGVWNAQKFQKPSEVINWTIFNLDRYIKDNELVNLAGMMERTGSRLGMNISKPKQPFPRCTPPNPAEIKKKFDVFKQHGLDLIVCVIPSNDDLVYGYVKKAAEIDTGCLTQCLKSFTVQRKLNDATVTNILLKVNAKRNGTNHSISRRSLPKVMLRPTMLMGADVTHPSPDARDIPSVAAVTASYDPNAFKYNICWRLQPPREEIISDLENITREQLMFFYRHNKCKPQHIIFYRDGVSDGQFQFVLNIELQAIRKACMGLEKDYKPFITFLVVQKRHHTRFFPKNPRDSEDRNNNVPAGTCVDTEITNMRAQDFYLVSHASIQGVAKPTKYRTLWDDMDMHEDELEELTYHLCHMFARCTRSVSYPAPTYYAHLAAARAKVYCDNRRIPEDRLAHEQQLLTVKDDIIKGLPMFFV